LQNSQDQERKSDIESMGWLGHLNENCRTLQDLVPLTATHTVIKVT